MLQEIDTYNPINKDLTKTSLTTFECYSQDGKLKDIFLIPHTVIYCSDGILPRVYGLPKIHKPGYTFRIIISSIDSPTYQLANYIHKIISKNILKPVSFIENSFQLVRKLNGVSIDNNCLISLDVIFLFTNIPIDLALESVTNRWNHICRGTSIPKEEFINAINMKIDSTFFFFNNQIYKQKFETLIGSPLSPVIADMVMQDLETRALQNLSVIIPLYYRYVNIAMTVPRHKEEDVLDAFNSFHPRLQFTIEKGGNNLNFLDVMIINNNNVLEF